jgi:hypothetical protein
MCLPACYCGQAAHRQDPACIVAEQTIDCTEGALGELLPSVVAVFTPLLFSSSSVDWNALAQQSEQAGLKDTGCILAAIEHDLAQKISASSTQAEKTRGLRESFVAWKVKKGLASVRFKYREVDL